MTGPKRNPDHPIFRVLIFDHGIVKFLLIFFLAELPLATAQNGTIPPQPGSNSLLGPGFNPTMAIVMVVLVTAFFLMGFFSVYVRRCIERRFPGNNADPYGAILGGASRRSLRGARGLDESTINTFPTFLYSAVKGLKIGNGSLECAVCLNEFEDEETLRLIPKCSHVFHTACIDAWLASHNTCPVCRANLVPQPGETPSCFVQIFNQDSNSGTGVPEQTSTNGEEISQVVQRRDVESLETSPINLQNRPPRSRSTGWRLTGFFPRSHSTGHSLVPPREDFERFTLRLPEEVRNQLITSSLNRSKSCVAFPRVMSSRSGFRSRSEGRTSNFYERLGRPSRSGHWGLRLTPPFISRMGSVRSPKLAGDGVEVTCSPLKRFRSLKLPPDRLLTEDDRNGERSCDGLGPDHQV